MSKRLRGSVFVISAAALLTTVLTAQDTSARADSQGSALPGLADRQDAKVQSMDPAAAKKSEEDRAAAMRTGPAPVPPTWPEPSDRTVRLSGVSGVLKTPVSNGVVRLSAHADRTKVGALTPATARLKVLDRSKADAADVSGFLLTVARADGQSGESPAELTVDYSGFAHAGGGDWASRLQLVSLPKCALTTPAKAGCSAPRPVAGSVNHQEHKTLTAPVALGTDERVMAVTAASASSTGDYSATALSPAASWSAGRNSGDFTWNYPLRVPPAPAGPAPSLSIDYSAQSVDGRTAASNNQPSWIGEGFDLSQSYIERKYASCNDDGQTGKYDLCWKYENATLALNGQGGELVKGDNGWRLKNDDGSKIEKVVNPTANGDNDKESWVVTTLDGTKYYFGREHVLPGANDPVTNSVWTAPVAGDDKDEPCNSTAGFASSFCDNQAWRWNLDYVEDTHGNSMSLWYEKETNYYAKNGATSASKPYIRGGYPTKILYGQRAAAMSLNAPMQVVFTTQERCLQDCASLTSTTKHRWPDVPFDQICAAGATCTKVGPSFFSRRRLEQVTTKVFKGALYQEVDHWKLTQDFLASGDEVSGSALWLKSVTHTGRAPGTAATPLTISFKEFGLPNRVDSDLDGISPLRKLRVGTIWTETGAQITVNYAQPECVAETKTSPGHMPASAASNAMRCYPVRWQPPQSPEMDDWFHRHVVTQIRVNDVTGGADPVVTNYTYGGGGAWHYQENPLVPPKERNWSDWRGFRTVTTSSGDPAAEGPKSRTVTSYFRGMDGDWSNADGARKSVSIPDTQGGSQVDAPELAGLVREAITYAAINSNTEISGSLTDYWAHETAEQTVDLITVPVAKRIIRRANLVRPSAVTVRMPRDAGRPNMVHKATTTFDHDTGLPVTSEDLGEPGKSDPLCTVTSYAKNAATGLRSLVSRAVVSKGRCDAGSANPSQTRFISDQRKIYDEGSFGQAPIKGELRSVERATGYTSAGAPTYQTIATTTYDSLGRPTAVKDALGRTSQTVYTPTGAGALRETTTSSPPINPGNPNSPMLVTKTTYRPEWGSKEQETDPNKKVTDLEYDALGRVTAVWLPNQSKAAEKLPNMRYAYSLSATAPSYVRTDDLKTSADGYLSGYAIYDSLLRSRQVQSVAPNGGRLISETKYNTRGLPVLHNNDLWNSAAPSGSLAVVLDTAVPNQTLLTYDGVGRTTESTYASAAVPQWSTRMLYGGDTVTTLPPKGAPATAEIKDSRGWVIERREYNGSAVTPDFISSKYDYDPSGKVSKLTTAGATWTYEYDLVGRKIRSTDPDSGATAYEYDNADRLVALTNANQTKLITSYDNLDRKVSVHEGSKVDANLRLSWDYDLSGNLGQLFQSTRYTDGRTGPAYRSRIVDRNALYKPQETHLVIPASEGPELAGTYTTATNYRPDAETVDFTAVPGRGTLSTEKLYYTYNDLGQPLSMKSGDATYTNEVQYTDVGDPQRYELGNAENMDIINQFEQGTRRLLSSSSGDVETFSNHHYAYDQAGNLLKDDNKVDGDAQCYKYDGHARLTDAWSPRNADCAAAPSVAGLGGPAPYWQSWTYTPSGLRQTETDHTSAGNTTETYAYNSAQPHSLKSVTTTGAVPRPTASYAYDASGNTTQRPDPDNGVQALTWDAENKLQKLENVAGDTSYIYDADGGLILRKSPGETTLYVGSLELTLDTATRAVTSKREYSINNQVIAVRASATDLKWLVPDHHGTSSVAVDSRTLAVTKRYTTPFGERRGAEPVTWPNEHGFLGKPEDKLTGLTHIGAREYDPGIGRFISVDAVMDTSDPHQMLGYTYGSNNPATVSDPTGLLEREDKGGGVGCSGPCGSTTKPPAETKNDRGTNDGDTGGDNGGSNGGDGGDNNNSGGWRGALNKHVKKITHNLDRGKNAFLDYQAGIGAGGLDTIKGLLAASQMSFQCFPLLDCSGQANMVKTVVRDPKSLWDAMVAPIKQDWAAGEKTQAAGRVAFVIGEALIGTKGGASLLSTTARNSAAHAGEQAAEGAATAAAKTLCRSFAGATAVLMADGTRRNIKDIKPGDKVLATDPETGERAAKTVLHVWVHDDTLMDLVVDGGKVVTTEDHPFWSVTDGRFERADELSAGEKLLDANGRPVLVSRLVPRSAHQAQAYNLTVAGIHTYFVVAGRGSVLVHNADGTGIDLSAAELWSGGDFPLGGEFDSGGPRNGILYRNQNGALSNYAVYDADGIILRRVDLVGASHRGVPTPHVQKFTRNVNPRGQIFPKQDPIAHPAGSDDLPRVDC
ncbi:polymorphic toxin-type HINT domain-containing protein [Kribbella sp. NPDC056345]|uniref:polymorphic toxin-type HINT domain-containing protein n=1 Tax=Kribbella sp. NPDC056345 TaxID=3345789 RepID=UPI0035DBE27C